jgi:hypothetical protein
MSTSAPWSRSFEALLELRARTHLLKCTMEPSARAAECNVSAPRAHSIIVKFGTSFLRYQQSERPRNYSSATTVMTFRTFKLSPRHRSDQPVAGVNAITNSHPFKADRPRWIAKHHFHPRSPDCESSASAISPPSSMRWKSSKWAQSSKMRRYGRRLTTCNSSSRQTSGRNFA